MFDRNAYMRQWYKKWRKKTSKKTRSKIDYEKNIREYGITVEQYEALLKQQKGQCAICDTKPKRRRLDIDHNHETGKVRGLLCNPCNLLLGKVEKRGLQRVIKYLQLEV